jgi:hypothetical protein
LVISVFLCSLCVLEFLKLFLKILMVKKSQLKKNLCTGIQICLKWTGPTGSGIPVMRIRDVYPGSEFFHPGSRVKKFPDPGSASKNLSIFNQKIVSKLSEASSGMFIRILIFTHPGSRGQKGTGSGCTGSGSATLEEYSTVSL